MKKIFGVLLFVLAVSCSSTSSDEKIFQQIEIVKSDAIDIHDKLMIQMGDLKSRKKELGELLKVSNDSTKKIELYIQSITDADQAMWDWMHNFNISYLESNDSLTLVYFEAKLKGIEEVKLLFDSAMSQSEELVE